MSLDNTLTATTDSKLPDATGLALPISFIGWMAVTPSRMTNWSGRLAKMSGAASNFRRLAG